MPKLDSRFTIHDSRAYGFTLLEIIVTIGIISVIAAISIPALRNFNTNQQLDNAASGLINDLRLTQSRASSSIRCTGLIISTNKIKSSVKWALKFSNNNTSYEIFPYCDDQDGTGNLSIEPPIKTVSLPQGITVTTDCTTPPVTNNEIVFQNYKPVLINCNDASSTVKSFINITLAKGTYSKNVSINQGGTIGY